MADIEMEEEWTEQDEERWQAWGRAKMLETDVKMGQVHPVHHVVAREVDYTVSVYDAKLKVAPGAKEALDALVQEFGGRAQHWCEYQTEQEGGPIATTIVSGSCQLFADADGTETRRKKFMATLEALKKCANFRLDETPIYYVAYD